jgi:putative glycosyltransferase (TIGR04348 family)
LRVAIVTPAPPASHSGNRVTAERWHARLSELGHEVEIANGWDGQACDLLVALHARKSAASVARFHGARPGVPLVVALTGTDLYTDVAAGDLDARRALGLADRLVVLQPLAAEAVPAEERHKVRVILQSCTPVAGAPRPDRDRFDVCVLAHLRPVKDPFRAAEAARLLPAGSRLRVIHLGAIVDPALAERAPAEAAANPRWEWRGDRPREEALRTLASCRLLVSASLSEGGANAVSEAIAHGVPVVASRIPGSLGLLGADYPGYFPFGDAAALAVLLDRAETDPGFRRALAAHCARLAPRFAPEHERAAWRGLVAELAPAAAAGAAVR